jgi:NADP-dependent 3-hydroxy acid dehydrogenase YdfG
VKSLRILLTGGSSGIGAATAKVLTEAGHRVSVLARNTESLERVARACPSDRIRYEKVDVTDEEAVKKTVQAAINEWGGIDVCIPNAGLGIFAPLKDASLSDWKTMVDVNIGGVLNTLHACLPSLVENKGHVIQIGSIAARNVFPNSGIYCATKHAVLAISESLRLEFRDELAVTTINPGAVDTSFIDQTKDDELRENYRPQFEQGMQPEFIADAIAFAIASGGRGVFSEMTMRPDRR